MGRAMIRCVRVLASVVGFWPAWAAAAPSWRKKPVARLGLLAGQPGHHVHLGGSHHLAVGR